MAIESILSVGPALSSQQIEKSPVGAPVSSADAQQSFKTFFNEALGNVNSLQVQSDALTERLVRGEDVNLHEVMIAAQKATISLNATMEVRNKVVEAYQEIIRMPV